MRYKYSVAINRARMTMRIRVVLASYPGHSQLFNVNVTRCKCATMKSWEWPGDRDEAI